MDQLLQDLRYSVRLLIRTPGVAVIVVLTLALGVGVNTTIFSVVNTMILKPLPYEDAERLLFVMERHPDLRFTSVAYLNYLDWKEQNRSFEEMAIVRGQQYNLTGKGEPVRLMGAQASANLFAMLGAQPLMGRILEPQDGHPGADPVALLDYRLWQRRFGGDSSILGQALTLNDRSFTVVGVLRSDFKWFLQHQPPEIWTPIGLWADTDMLNQRGNRSGMNVIARLERGVALEEAQADLAMIAQRLEEQYPETNSGRGILTIPFHERVVGETRTPLMILLGAVGLVLLIACANVANLLLARATGRTKEIAVRIALGAGRRRLARQLLTESLVLALAGGVVGVLLAYWSVDLLVAASRANVPRIDEVVIDSTVLGFSAVLVLVTGILFGLAPALQSSRPDLNHALKDSIRGSTSTGERNHIRSLLVVAEVALALVLLIGASLMIKSFWRLQIENPGFNPDNILTAKIVLTGSAYPDEDTRRAFHGRLLGRLRSLPGVRAAGTVNPLPLTHTGWQTRFMVEGRARPQSGEFPFAEWMQISPGYFRTIGIPLLRGRGFTDRDDNDAPPVVVIDEAFANRHFANEDPVGQRIVFGDPDHPTWSEIVGIVGHVKLNGVAEEAGIQLYMPYMQGAYAPITLILHTTADPGQVVSTLRSGMMALDPQLPVYDIRMMDELLDDTVAARRLAMILLTSFAFLALVLVAVGIYGVMAYTASERTHEIGIRMALGARPTFVVGLVVRQGMALALTGLAIGMAAAYGLTHLMGSMLFGVEPNDPMTFSTIPFILAIVALVASYIPARRASRVDPLVALRHQ